MMVCVSIHLLMPPADVRVLLMLFVLVDGWQLLIGSFAESFYF